MIPKQRASPGKEEEKEEMRKLGQESESLVPFVTLSQLAGTAHCKIYLLNAAASFRGTSESRIF